MSQRRPPDDDDDDTHAFRRALREAGVRRIAVNRADPGRPRRRDPAAAERRAAAVAADSQESASRTSDGRVEAVRPSEFLDFALPDLPYRTRSQLKRGQFAWEAGLDLHGYSLDEARLELESFLKEAASSHMRCVLVVHGKAWGSTANYPVIKSHVNAWLREWPTVLAFCSARELDGGTGAVYVLLRRRGQTF
ncbi:DNA mismatch repair protein MutS [Halomonas sp. MCCC 1A17488]|uniref:Smr/MutS family protein n=1 Tax=unclassified Halomonas TaxID=2609666 RepID=UPI0018D259CE|nr:MULTISPECIES: Smr/MutS family protein [unclassified Halomonas]MCE8018269.1 DNA mismatch repair protein MutS [Halomonas sp. MCCC 1A17488]MCG3241602.1 DNA mismatch repair protein MutS [Halomonas sp. MCCC 1A17488]QPP48451.1 Smr/MutS family protein [Halomonas sp. SS10-MC5]